jgi:hypothetical protein
MKTPFTPLSVFLAMLLAHLRVNGKESACPVIEGLSGAEISIDLEAGPATLQAWFVERDQATKAVYFIDVERKESK